MQFGICTLSLVPCRKEPAGTSEMVTQLLFGEHYTVIGQHADWLKIKTAYDQYECWISEKQHTRISEQVFKKLQAEVPLLCNDLVQPVQNKNANAAFPLTIGSVLPFIGKNEIKFDNFNFHFDGQTCDSGKKRGANEIISTAFVFQNAPYLWGGKSPFGIDCSGFTQLVYRLNGYKLPRDAYQQVDTGTPLTFADEAEAGDIAFFDNEEGKIVHVGILIDKERIIHASGFVRVDRYDHYGIFGSDAKKYTHHLRVIKRLL
jgi:hypothetical protein